MKTLLAICVALAAFAGILRAAEDTNRVKIFQLPEAFAATADAEVVVNLSTNIGDTRRMKFSALASNLFNGTISIPNFSGFLWFTNGTLRTITNGLPGQVLTFSNGVPQWVAATFGGAAPNALTNNYAPKASLLGGLEVDGAQTNRSTLDVAGVATFWNSATIRSELNLIADINQDWAGGYTSKLGPTTVVGPLKLASGQNAGHVAELDASTNLVASLLRLARAFVGLSDGQGLVYDGPTATWTNRAVGGSGEVNVLGDAGATNAARLSLAAPKVSVTLMLKTISPGYGLSWTNEATNLVVAITDAELVEWSGAGTNLFLTTNHFLFRYAASNNVQVAAGAGLGVAGTGAAGVQTWTISVTDPELLEWAGLGTNYFLTTNHAGLRFASSNNVQVVAGTGGIGVSSAGAAGVQTHTISITDAELLQWGGIATNLVLTTNHAIFINGISNNVRLVAGTGVAVSSSGSAGVMTHTVSISHNTTTQRVEVVRNSGAILGARKQLNFIEGANTTLTIADDAGNEQVDITIASSGGGLASSNYTALAADTLTLTNALLRRWVWLGNTTNIVLTWAQTNDYIAAPSNTFTVSFSGTPPVDWDQSMELMLYVPAGAAGYFPTNELNGGSVKMLGGPSTNRFIFHKFGSNIFSASLQALTTGTGDTNVLNVAPNLHTPTNWNGTYISRDGATRLTLDLAAGTAAADQALKIHSVSGNNLVVTNKVDATGGGSSSNFTTVWITNNQRFSTTNIIVSSTNNILLDLQQATLFKVLLLTNANLQFTNQGDGIARAQVLVQQDTNGQRTVNWSVAGGLLQTNANLAVTTNANALDMLEVASAYFSTNLMVWWPQNFQPRIGATNSLAGGGGGGSGGLTSTIFNETLEGTGYSSPTWTEVLNAGVADEDYATGPLDGSQSLRILTASDNQTYAYKTFTAGAERWIYFMAKPVSTPNTGDVRLMEIWDSGFSPIFAVEMTSSGTVKVQHGTVESAATSTALSDGTTYHFYVRFLAGSGANGVGSVSFTTDGTRTTSGNTFTSTSAGTATANANILALGWIGFSGIGEMLYDKIQVGDSTSAP